jgi:transposase
LLAGRRARGLRVVCQPSAEDLFDRRLTSRRVVSSHDLTRTINRIKAILRRHNLEQECPTKGLGTLKSLAWLKRLELPGVDRLEMNQMLRRWELLKCERQELDDQIAQRQKQNRAAIILATIPGIAAYGALALAYRIGDSRRFPQPRSLANDRARTQAHSLLPGYRPPNPGDNVPDPCAYCNEAF